MARSSRRRRRPARGCSPCIRGRPALRRHSGGRRMRARQRAPAESAPAAPRRRARRWRRRRSSMTAVRSCRYDISLCRSGTAFPQSRIPRRRVRLRSVSDRGLEVTDLPAPSRRDQGSVFTANSEVLQDARSCAEDTHPRGEHHPDARCETAYPERLDACCGLKRVWHGGVGWEEHGSFHSRAPGPRRSVVAPA